MKINQKLKYEMRSYTITIRSSGRKAARYSQGYWLLGTDSRHTGNKRKKEQ